MFFDQLDSSQVARVEAIIQCVVAAFEEDHTEELTVNLITPMHYDTSIKETYCGRIVIGTRSITLNNFFPCKSISNLNS